MTADDVVGRNKKIKISRTEKRKKVYHKSSVMVERAIKGGLEGTLLGKGFIRQRHTTTTTASVLNLRWYEAIWGHKKRSWRELRCGKRAVHYQISCGSSTAND